ncbi:hypothetical protein [Novosphingobium sp.]|uniref:hypothetical protein n=1 Tax=Novosphingobium sp. TaxID=1874826 RepID=UPI0025E268F2|nr:hypothetical protein [Novosphingobium sp.]
MAVSTSPPVPRVVMLCAVLLTTLTASTLPAQTARKSPKTAKPDPGSAFEPDPLGCMIRLRFLQGAAGRQAQQTKEAGQRAQAAVMSERAYRGVYFFGAALLNRPADERTAPKAEAIVTTFAAYPREKQAAEAMKCLRTAETALVTLGDSLREAAPPDAGR